MRMRSVSPAPLVALVARAASRSARRPRRWIVRHGDSPFDSRFAAYEDRRVDYVTSEPAIDYAASSIMLLAALEGRC